MKRLALAIVLALLSAPGFGAEPSLERARLLFTNKLYDEAKRELVAIAVSEAPAEDKAHALNLLGDIAIYEGNYEVALKNWTQLIETYPTSTAAAEARSKLPLARKLAASPSTSSSTSTSITLQTLPAPEKLLDPGTVLVAGSAPEAPEYADQAVLEFMNVLMSKGVRVQDAFAGRVATPGMSRMETLSLPNLLRHANQVGAAGVLYVFIHFHGMENMRVECYATNGQKVWSEKVSASVGLGPSGMTEGFIRRMTPKLIKHVGQPCLPQDSGHG